MAGETGRDREGPSPPGPINSISWVGPGGPKVKGKWTLFASLGLFFSNCNSCIGSFGPFETLGSLYLEGPPRPSPPPPPPTSGILSPALPTLSLIPERRTALSVHCERTTSPVARHSCAPRHRW